MGKREPSVENLTFINHTECHCISRRSPVHNSNQHSFFRPVNARNSSLTPSEINSQFGNRCRCVKDFKVLYDRVESSDEDDGVAKSQQLCRCDCESDNDRCDWLKKGKDGFAGDDRQCITDKRCVRPTCEYGQYNMRLGRCPKLEDKLAGARGLSFD